MEKQGIDLKAEMEKKLLEMESQYRREKEKLELEMLKQTKVDDAHVAIIKKIGHKIVDFLWKQSKRCI